MNKFLMASAFIAQLRARALARPMALVNKPAVTI
jgi:hypothetical protein